MDRSVWNAIVAANGPRSGSFLQSWEWGSFQEAAGARVLRVGRDETVAQFVLRPLPLGLTVAYLPRGPVGHDAAVMETVREAAADAGAILLRVDPVSAERPAGAKEVHEAQPRTTLLLDLSKSEDELLAAMHEKTRYNVRLAEKKGVTVREGGTELSPRLWPLLAAAAARDRFRTHDRGYYETMMRTLAGDAKDRGAASVRILIAEHEGATLAGMLLLTFGNDAVYLHGGSSDEKRNLMAPHLLQWEAIRRAKAWGYRNYDLGGISPMKDGMLEPIEGHPLAGVTRFKRGFGGEVWSAPASWELPLRPAWYTIYALAQRIRGR